MSIKSEARDALSLGRWVGRACLATLIGYGVIALTIHANLSTLFEYNGKISESNPREVSGAEIGILLEFLLLGVLVGYLLWQAVRARHRGGVRPLHVLPLLIACAPLFTALLAAAWGVAGFLVGPI